MSEEADCPYRILGVTAASDDAQIAAAYRKLALLAHPDKGGDPDEFRKLTEAKDTLLDPQRRRAYDEEVGPQRDGYHQSVYYLNVTVASLYRDTSYRIRYDRLEGAGRVPRLVVMSVTIPRGSRSGSRHVLDGWGDFDDSVGTHRPLVVVATADETAALRTVGADVFSHVRLTLAECLGCQAFAVCLPDGTVVRVPALDRVYPPSSTIVLRGYGLPAPDRGDLHLKVLVSFPSEVPRAVRAALLEAASKSDLGDGAMVPVDSIDTRPASAEFRGRGDAASAASAASAAPTHGPGDPCPIQ